MTINALMANFQQGLLCMIPRVERVGIPWAPACAYDEWDSLVSTIYQALVVEPVRSSLPESEQERFNLPDYDMLIPSYEGKSVIEIAASHGEETVQVFHRFGSVARPLDTVEWRVVGPTGMPESDLLESAPLEGARFALRTSMKSFASERVEEIEISLLGV